MKIPRNENFNDRKPSLMSKISNCSFVLRVESGMKRWLGTKGKICGDLSRDPTKRRSLLRRSRKTMETGRTKEKKGMLRFFDRLSPSSAASLIPKTVEKRRIHAPEKRL